MPGYGSIRRDQLEITPVDLLQNLSVTLGHHRYDFSIASARIQPPRAQRRTV